MAVSLFALLAPAGQSFPGAWPLRASTKLGSYEERKIGVEVGFISSLILSALPNFRSSDLRKLDL
jgi:hypothetical protein